MNTVTNNEKYLLGGILRHWQKNNGKFIKAVSIIKPEYFTTTEGMNIFVSITKVLQDGNDPDVNLVECNLAPIKHDHYSTWTPALVELFSNSSSAANIVTVAYNIKAEYDAKMANNAFVQAMEALNDLSNPNPRGRIKNALNLISGIDVQDDHTKSSFDMKEMLSNLMDRMDQANKHGGMIGLSTGFNNLDKIIDGFQSGETYVLAGSPGSGKTTLSINFMVNALMDNKRVLMYSLEMPNDQIAMKLMSYKSGVHQSIIRNGDTGSRKENQTMFDAAFSQMMGKSLVVDEGINLTAENLDITTKKHELKLGGIDLVIVDYLTLMDAQGESETVKASNAAKACKRLAKKYRCPVIILAQFVKNVIGRPKKSDLKQTGQIEQDAAGIFLLYKDPEIENASVECEIAKNRFGEIGMTYFDAEFSVNKFEEKSEPKMIEDKTKEKKSKSMFEWDNKNAN